MHRPKAVVVWICMRAGWLGRQLGKFTFWLMPDWRSR